jgi:hypothetical protein
MNSTKANLPRFRPKVVFGLGTEAKPYLARISNFLIVCGVTGADFMLPSMSFRQPWSVLLRPAQALLDAGYPPDSHWRLDWATTHGTSCLFIGTLRAASAIAGSDPNILIIKRTQIRRFREWADPRISGEYSVVRMPVEMSGKRSTKTGVVMTNSGLAMWRLATDVKDGQRFLRPMDE